VGCGLRGIARAEVGAIAKHLKGRRSNDEGHAVHEARKHLKKTRALLRLVRDELGDRAYRQENGTFRDIGRVLSARRDAEVLVEAFQKLRRQHARVPETGLLKLENLLRGRHQKIFETGAGNHDPGPSLKAARRRVGGWPLEHLKSADLVSALERTYRRGREALKEAGLVRTNENLHAWRKRVKDLGYQLRLVEPLSPKTIAEVAEATKKLGELLGDDHDLAMLDAVSKSARLTRKEARSISEWIRGHRESLQAAAFDLGRRFYADQPARFAERIRENSRKANNRRQS
jgi:CHAD domain-containing protein